MEKREQERKGVTSFVLGLLTLCSFERTYFHWYIRFIKIS